jgi:predicted N-acyltransferase
VSGIARRKDEGRRGARFAARLAGGVAEVGADAWERLETHGNPFVGYEFLSALEDSGCCRAETGWLPQHIVVEDEAGRVLGAMPAYLKSHSFGEYVFDHGWADAFERAGGRYYPKLQVSVPFTPVTGPRLLVARDADAEAVRGALIQAAVQLSARIGVSSLHVTFPTEPEWRLMGEAGMLLRTGEQFHWQNRGYQSFDDFLATLNARKRKMIRKERRRATEAGIAIRTLSGDDIKPRHWDAFYDFYMDTGSRKWGSPYLNREFFALLGERLGDKVALVMCERDGDPIAGALNLIGGDTIYGRNWGCIEYHDFLHFEACYYRAIDFAVQHGLKWVEAGAQGPHKIQRGYLPTRTYSAHWIADSAFRKAVEDYLRRERRQVDWEIEIVAREHTPYRKTAE